MQAGAKSCSKLLCRMVCKHCWRGLADPDTQIRKETHINGIHGNAPFLWLGIDCVPQCIVWIVLKGHPCSGVPLGVLLATALLSVGTQLQFLALPQLDNQDI